MKNRELIAKLSALDLDADVCFHDSEWGTNDIFEIECFEGYRNPNIGINHIRRKLHDKIDKNVWVKCKIIELCD